MKLDEIEKIYLETNRSAEQVENLVQEELDEKLEEREKTDIREEIRSLGNEEFRELALNVLDQIS